MFGPLTYQRTSDPAQGYWEGSGFFAPVGRTVEWFIDAGLDGPGESQRAFLQELVTRYADVQLSIAPAFNAFFTEWFRRSPPPDWSSVFALTGISVPGDSSLTSEWDLTFDCAEDHEHIFNVPMRGWTPSGPVRADG